MQTLGYDALAVLGKDFNRCLQLATILTYSSEEEKIASYLAMGKAIADSVNIFDSAKSYEEAERLYLSTYKLPITKLYYSLNEKVKLDIEMLSMYTYNMYKLRIGIAFGEPINTYPDSVQYGALGVLGFHKYFDVSAKQVLDQKMGLVITKTNRARVIIFTQPEATAIAVTGAQ